MDILEQRLQGIREAYTRSRLMPILEVDERPLQGEIQGVWEERMSEAELALFQQCRKYRAVGLSSARQGKYALADYLFGAVEKILQSGSFSQVAFLLTQAEHEAAVAYLDYRRENFQRGTGHIYRALECYRALEMLYGYRVFHLQRVRQLLDLLRLKRRQGCTEEVVEMAFALMNYLEQKIPTLPYPTVWDAQALTDQSPVLKKLLFEQAIFEVAFVVSGEEQTPPRFLELAHAHLTAAVPCSLSPCAHTWLASRLALAEQDLPRYLEMAQQLIAAGPGEIIWLWYATLLDLLPICQDLSGKQATLLHQEVTEQLSGWPWRRFPPLWQKAVQKGSQQHMCA